MLSKKRKISEVFIAYSVMSRLGYTLTETGSLQTPSTLWEGQIFYLKKITGQSSHVAIPLSLSKEDVELWHVDLNAAADSEACRHELLSSDERDRASRFHFEQDRRHYRATRALLRTLLGTYLQVDPQGLRFQYSDKGKPGLTPRHEAGGVAFNVSHSGDFALLGFTRRNCIGVDIEKIRDDFDTAAIACRFFSAREQDELSRLPADQQHHAFFRCWTRKEAFIKALGEGLSHPLHQFDVSLGTSGPVSLTTRPDAEEGKRWWLQTVDAGPGYAAAVAVSNR